MNGSTSGLASGTPGTQQSLEQSELAFIVADNQNDIQNMPNYTKALTPIEKFTNYSLDYNNPNAKGKAEAYVMTTK